MSGRRAYQYYNEHAKTCAPDDFWGQVKRSVNGRVIGEDQVELIVGAILDGLEVRENDALLDLCCGNGVLTDRIFERCTGGLGVDLGDYLISVAKTHFERLPHRRYAVADVDAFLSDAPDGPLYSKILCYSSFQYFPKESAIRALTNLAERFPHAERVFLGNMPDKSRISAFYYDGQYVAGAEDDYESPLGMWRTKEEVAELARSAGWEASFKTMPAAFYAAHYRFDAILVRRTH